MRAIVFALALAAVLVDCKRNDVDQDTTNITNNFTQVIGPEGGRVGVPGSAYVDIPPGALTVPTTIRISPAAAGSYPALPDHTSLMGSVWSFEPHGQTFASDVTISLPAPVSAMVYLMRASPGGLWGAGPVEANGTAAITRTVGFSFYAVSATSPCSVCSDGMTCNPSTGLCEWADAGVTDGGDTDTGPTDNLYFTVGKYSGGGLAGVLACVDGDDTSCRTSSSTGYVSMRVPTDGPFVIRLSLSGYVPVLWPLDRSTSAGGLESVGSSFMLSTTEQAGLAYLLGTSFDPSKGFAYFLVTTAYISGVPGIDATLATGTGTGPVYFTTGSPIGIATTPYTSSVGSGFFHGITPGNVDLKLGKATATCNVARRAPWGAPTGADRQTLPVRAGHVTVMAFYCVSADPL